MLPKRTHEGGDGQPRSALGTAKEGPDMPRRICAISGKGGAGKTTVIILVAGEYAIQGKKILLIDADPRQNLAEWWKRCEAKDNLPANVELHSAATQRSIETCLPNKTASTT